MPPLQKDISKPIIFYGLLFFYFNFFINLITDDRASWSLVYIPLALFILYLFKNRTLYIHPLILIIGFSSALCISLNEYIFHANQASTDLEFNKQADKYLSQFLYIIPLIFLGTLFKFSNFTSETFKKIIFITIVFSIIFNSYLNIQFGFDRGLLISEFKSIILYDYCVIALSLIGLVFSFRLKGKFAFLFISLCLVNITLIVLHGSRGAWLGIPIALLMISLYFYKTHLKQVLYMLSASLVLSVGICLMPHSPIIERIDLLKSDASLMEQNNYDTSVGTRFALWHFAIEQFQQSPYVGQGFINFKNKICTPNAENEVPNCQPHAHNIVFQELAAHGLLGFLNILILAFATLYYFTKNMIQKNNPSTQLLAFSGLISSVYLIICSMSDYLLFYSFPTMFLFLITLSLMNIIYIENINTTHNNGV
ncbi:O-antigen ligase [Acinetobacter sp. P8-3-8]|uniref:O-antigen ligase family protein n=1 Tax=Acinetobacter sp. P8-3-8 TaxID=1029823 RepID=UPI0002485D14|nr:O-antigen ligase family protein [Acinetobacter sp. P8-3-8]